MCSLADCQEWPPFLPISGCFFSNELAFVCLISTLIVPLNFISTIHSCKSYTSYDYFIVLKKRFHNSTLLKIVSASQDGSFKENDFLLFQYFFQKFYILMINVNGYLHQSIHPLKFWNEQRTLLLGKSSYNCSL